MITVTRLLVLLLVLVSAQQVPAQEEIPPQLETSAFDGWEEWPLIGPDDLELDTSSLSNLRLVFDGVFGPPGQARPVTMYMDVFEHWYGDRPSFWVQWTSSGNPAGAPDVLGIDALIVDRRDLRVLFRVAAAGPGGQYAVTRHGPDEVEQYRINTSENTAASYQLEGEHPTFDFATLQFLFPFLDLEPGHTFRIPNVGQPPDLAPGELAVRVAGTISLEIASGEQVEVWDVQVMPTHRRALIYFYVTTAAPYFYGWDYRIVGGMLTTMRLYDWQPMLARTPADEVS